MFREWFKTRGTKKAVRHSGYRPKLELLEDRLSPAIFTVTNTDTSGPGSLLQAMLDAESTPNVGGPDEIHFNIPGGGVHTIFPGAGVQSPLPTITEAVIIDGYTQPGASPNTRPVGDDAVLTIEINGSNMSPGAKLFIINGSDDSTVRGLAITHVPDATFALGYFGQSASHNTIVGNFLGTDAGGLTHLAGDGPAVSITVGSNNVIGGPDPADRNVIAPGRFVPTASIGMGSGTGNVIQGNYIGVNKDGTAALQSPFGGFGIDIGQDSGSNTITGNVIFATLTGIRLTQGNTGSNVVQDNLIGTNAIGTAGLGGGQFGLDIQSSSDTITGNLISGFSTGININHQGLPGPGPTIQGNKIGTDVTGTLAIPNSGDGIFLLSSPGGATIGGTNPGDGNTIANSGRNGVWVNVGTGCSILGNSIFASGRLGITLNGDANPLPNDAGDIDPGANGFQNFPLLSFAGPSGSQSVVGGTLNSTPGTVFRIEFFASDAADPSGFGEGQTFLGAITTDPTDGNGDVSFTATLQGAVGIGQIVSATATDPAGNTSEFSQDVTATSLDVIVDASTTQEFLDSLTIIYGSLIMVDVAGRTDLILPNLTEVDGDVIITGNPDLATLSLPLLATVGGDIDVSNNPVLTAVNLGSVTTLGGSVDINGNTAANTIDTGSLTTVGGAVDINGNTAANTIDTGSLTTVSGSVSINGNTAANTIDTGSLTTVGGSVDINGNTAANTIDTGSLTTVGGDESVEAPNSVTSATADGSTAVTLFSAAAQMTAVLAAGTYDHAVDFTVIRIDPAALPPEQGQDSTGGAATIDPLAAYKFNFAIPTLGQNATLTFEINLAALSPADRDAFLAALAAGNATVAVKNDAPGSVYRAFAVAAPGQPADATHVTISQPDADHVVFTGVTGHFSNFAVVIVSPAGGNNLPVAGDDTANLNSTPSATINVLANDSDPNGDPLTVTAVTQPASGHGNVTINADGTLTYTQTIFVNGTENFTYTISDGQGGTATAAVTVTVDLSASVGIHMLKAQVRHSRLSSAPKLRLLATLHESEIALSRGRLHHAANEMKVFVAEVRALRHAHQLAPRLAALWVFEASNVIAEIG